MSPANLNYISPEELRSRPRQNYFSFVCCTHTGRKYLYLFLRVASVLQVMNVGINLGARYKPEYILRLDLLLFVLKVLCLSEYYREKVIQKLTSSKCMIDSIW